MAAHHQPTRSLLEPPPQAIIYDSELAYAALASYPITRGHTIVVWKKPVEDLSKLTEEEFAYLMFTVEKVRNALMKFLRVKKVYLMYMDEIKHVHWHLIPRHSVMGLTVLRARPKLQKSFSLAPKLHRLLAANG